MTSPGLPKSSSKDQNRRAEEEKNEVRVLKLAAEKKYSKNGAVGKYFGPSYSETALVLKDARTFE